MSMIEQVVSFSSIAIFSARRLSKMTSKLSKSMLDGVGIVTGSVMAPVVNSKAGKSFLGMVPGQVLLASLDAISKYPKLCTFFYSTCKFTY